MKGQNRCIFYIALTSGSSGCPFAPWKAKDLGGEKNRKMKLKDSEGAEHDVVAPWSFEVWYVKKRAFTLLVKREHAKAQVILRGMVARTPVVWEVDVEAELSFISKKFLKDSLRCK